VLAVDFGRFPGVLILVPGRFLKRFILGFSFLDFSFLVVASLGVPSPGRLLVGALLVGALLVEALLVVVLEVLGRRANRRPLRGLLRVMTSEL
jgi:hypothetical protein